MSNKRSKERVKDIQSEGEFVQLLEDFKEKLVAVHFYEENQDNSTQSKLLEELSSIGSAIFVKVNVEKLRQISDKYGVSSIPSFGVFKDSSLVEQITTSNQKEMEDKLKSIQLRVDSSSDEDHYHTSPNYTGFRKWLRDYLFEYVKSGTQLVVDTQKGHTRRKTLFYQFVSITGNHSFLVAFFPVFFFGFGYHEMGRQIFVLLSSGVLVGNYFKDYLCLPRPLPPVQRLSPLHTKEFGMPSTHSVTAFNTPFYLIYKLYRWDSWEFAVACLFGLIYTYIISYSRIYLGMHSLPDILGGIGIAIVLLAMWISFGFDYLEEWVAHGSYVPVIVVTVAAILLFLHPEPYDFCPCFEDSVCFTAAAAGIVAGGARYPYQHSNIDRSISMCLIRYLIGMVVLLGSRFLLKPTMYRILPWIFRTFNPPRRRFLERFNIRTKIDHSKVIRPLPSIARIESKGQVNYDIDIPTKFVVYLAMGWIGAEGGPSLFWLLNLH